MGDYPPPTRAEHERMRGLRAMLSNAGLASLPLTMRLGENGGEERALLRFTRARKDTEKSFAMLKATLAWRADIGADTCLGEPLSEAHAGILGQIPGFYLGHGRNGHPVFLDHTAVVPWDTILQSMGMRPFLHAQVQCLEWVSMVVYQDASRRAGRPISQGINVWDMKGLTLSAFTAKVREISGATSKIAQDNYPESLAAAYIVNAPTVFSVVWAVVRQFLDPRTVAKVHIMGSGPKMYAKLKEALGPDCFLAEHMVCCKKADVGKAEQAMGLQSGMAASQTWIRERVASGIPWSEEAASTTAAAATSRAAAEPRSFLGGAQNQNQNQYAGAPITSAALAGLGGGGGSYAAARTPSSAGARSVDSEGEEQFFDAESEDFSDFGGSVAGEEDAAEMSMAMLESDSGDPLSPGMEQFNGSKCMSAILGHASPVPDSQVKLINGSETPSDSRRDRGGGGSESAAANGGAAGEVVARDRARLEAEKEARAAATSKKSWCGCC